MHDEKHLVYTHRIHFTLTGYNEPHRKGIKSYQDFTREDWAKEFMEYAKSSKYYEKVYLRRIDSIVE